MLIPGLPLAVQFFVRPEYNEPSGYWYAVCVNRASGTRILAGREPTLAKAKALCKEIADKDATITLK